MLSFTIINIVFYLLFSQVANAYWLHASCLTLTNADQVEAQIKEAFKLADEMADMFKGWQGPDNLDADSKRLFNLLVGGDGNGFNASASYKGVGRNTFLSDRQLDEDTALVKFYCDTKWMKQIKVKGKTVLKDIKANWGIFTDKIESKGTCQVAHAFTASPVAENDPVSWIQLCPWFIALIDERSRPDQTTFLGKVYVAWDKFGQKLGIYPGLTRVDDFAWPYITIFHELMHTPQGKSREDLGGPVRSYGWNNVVTLGRRKDNWNNADNLAYFALAMHLKKQNLIVQNNGEILRVAVSQRIRRYMQRFGA